MGANAPTPAVSHARVRCNDDVILPKGDVDRSDVARWVRDHGGEGRKHVWLREVDVAFVQEFEFTVLELEAPDVLRAAVRTNGPVDTPVMMDGSRTKGGERNDKEAQ